MFDSGAFSVDAFSSQSWLMSVAQLVRRGAASLALRLKRAAASVKALGAGLPVKAAGGSRELSVDPAEATVELEDGRPG